MEQGAEVNDDVALMQSVKAGCKESFEKLVLKYRTNAISFAIKYVKVRDGGRHCPG